MNSKDFSHLEIGDRIEFRSPTRSSNRKAIRVITGFPKTYDTIETWGARSTDAVLVKFEGWTNFHVRRSEIIRKITE